MAVLLKGLMDCRHARNERRCHWPAAHGIDAPTKSSSAPARPKRRRARRRDERYHYQHELADVRQRRLAKDHIQSIPTRPPSGAVRNHFLLAQPSLRSAALVVLSHLHRWRERLDGKTKRFARSRLAVCSLPRASTTLKTRETSAGGNQARAEVGAGQGPERPDPGCRAFRLPFQALPDEKKSRTPPILKGFLDQVEFPEMGMWCRKQDFEPVTPSLRMTCSTN